MQQQDVWVCVDIESDGTVAGMHNLLAFAAVAFRANGHIIAEFSCNLLPTPGMSGHPDTLAWWQTQKETWAALQQDQVEAGTAMQDFADWLKSLPGRAVLVSHPATFDFPFMRWYSFKYLGYEPYCRWGIDVPSFAMAVLGKPFSQRHDWPAELNEVSSPHSHLPLDDARGHAQAFCNLLKRREELWGKAEYQN